MHPSSQSADWIRLKETDDPHAAPVASCSLDATCTDASAAAAAVVKGLRQLCISPPVQPAEKSQERRGEVVRWEKEEEEEENQKKMMHSSVRAAGF
jgi:hypothetical protein